MTYKIKLINKPGKLDYLVGDNIVTRNTLYTMIPCSYKYTKIIIL